MASLKKSSKSAPLFAITWLALLSLCALEANAYECPASKIGPNMKYTPFVCFQSKLQSAQKTMTTLDANFDEAKKATEKGFESLKTGFSDFVSEEGLGKAQNLTQEGVENVAGKLAKSCWELYAEACTEQKHLMYDILLIGGISLAVFIGIIVLCCACCGCCLCAAL